MRKRSDTDPAAKEPKPQTNAMEPQPAARVPEPQTDAMEPQPGARGAEVQPDAGKSEAQSGAAIRKRTEAGRGSREDREGRGRRVVRYLRRHAWAVARLLCGAGALTVLGTLRGEVPLLFALLALWGAGELIAGALRRRK